MKPEAAALPDFKSPAKADLAALAAFAAGAPPASATANMQNMTAEKMETLRLMAGLVPFVLTDRVSISPSFKNYNSAPIEYLRSVNAATLSAGK